MKLFLVGYAGSGKSTLARSLSRRLGCRYVDTDKRVEQMVGASIADIFFYEGEEYFRRSEREALEQVTALDENIVIAIEEVTQQQKLIVYTYRLTQIRNLVHRSYWGVVDTLHPANNLLATAQHIAKALRC